MHLLARKCRAHNDHQPVHRVIVQGDTNRTKIKPQVGRDGFDALSRACGQRQRRKGQLLQFFRGEFSGLDLLAQSKAGHAISRALGAGFLFHPAAGTPQRADHFSCPLGGIFECALESGIVQSGCATTSPAAVQDHVDVCAEQILQGQACIGYPIRAISAQGKVPERFILSAIGHARQRYYCPIGDSTGPRRYALANRVEAVPLSRMASRVPAIFYGWWNVAASFVGLSLSYAMFTVFSFGVFVSPLQAEFGWGRGPMSLALTIANISVVAASPLLGALVDRIGARRVMVTSIALLGLCVASMSELSGDIRHYYLMHFLIPFLGAGTLPLAYSRIIVAWFEKRRGLALGIALAGFGVGAALIPILGQRLTGLFGWREAYLVFGALVLLISLPLAAFVLREKPSDMGLLPDGEVSPHGEPARAATLQEIGLSLPQALRTRPFWLLVVSLVLIGVGITSVLAHLVPMLVGRGMEPARAAFAMSLLGLGLIFGRVLSGWLMDRFFAPYVAAGFQLGMICGLVILALDFSGMLAFVAGIPVGLATGAEISEISYLVSRYFGLKSFGLINGIMFAAFQLGSGAGAYAMGAWFDQTGNYIGALWVVSGLAAISTLLIVVLGPYPNLKAERDSE